MNDQEVLATIKKLRDSSPKRKFSQTVDLIINLKQLDLKKTEQQVNTFIVLPHALGKKLKVCALVDKELFNSAKECCDRVIMRDEFAKFDKKSLRRLANDYDFFIAQANIMPDVAKYMGKVLGTKGKMPNPKADCVIPPTANVKDLYNKLQRTIKLQTKNEQAVKCRVATESMSDDEIKDNVMAVYNSLLRLLPREKHNIKEVLLKLTMGPAFTVGAKDEA
ncbi:MAG: 50S ribosomal protein L1 [Candidatus Nanoarchaeia archaeon]